MIQIYSLCIILIFLICVSYTIFNRDLFSPSVVICLVFTLSILALIVNKKVWNVEFHWNSFFVLTVGLLFFFFGEVVMYFIVGTKKKQSYKLNEESKSQIKKLEYISMDEWKVNVTIVFSIITLILYFKEVYRVSILAGNTGGIANMMVFYREFVSRNIASIGNGVNVVVLQMAKVTHISALIFTFIIINNYFYNRSLKKEKKKFVFIIIYFLQIILSGARQSLINYFGAVLLIYYVLWLRDVNWTKVINSKFIKIGIMSIIMVFLIFFSFRTVVGRTGRLQEENIITYITHYMGGSIQAFDMYMQLPPSKSVLVGSETFTSLYSFLQKYMKWNTTIMKSLEFRFIGNNRTNVYTAFRRYYQDFGYVGIIILPMLMSMFYSWFYYKKVKYNNDSYKNNKLLLIYALIFFPLIFISIEENFYSTIISANYLIYIVIFNIMYSFFFKNTK